MSDPPTETPRRRIIAKVALLLGLTAAAAGVVATFPTDRLETHATTATVAASAPTPPPVASAEPLLDDIPEDCVERPRAGVVPTGEPPSLECDQARRIVGQARTSLATPASAIDKQKFLAATSDWLDPHGLWSVAPDAPVNGILTKVGDALIGELEAPAGSGPCGAADEVAHALSGWVAKLRREMIEGRTLGRAQTYDPKKRWEIASSTPFEDGTVTRKGKDLARLLGHGMGLLERAYGSEIAPLADLGLERAAPEKSEQAWAKNILAAAVRAYVPQLDPHGAWAPLDEETSIYDLDLEVDPPQRLWKEMTRTTLGVRIDEGARSPLRNGDVVLRVHGVAVAGLSVEQANQLALGAELEPTKVSILRSGVPQPIDLEVDPALVLLAPAPSTSAPTGLSARQIRYGDGYVLVVRIGDVPDDLGERLRSTLFDRPATKRAPVGVLLDLRGNGGGSTDGALGALGIFLPGAALFPMRRRGGEVEIDRAPKLPSELVWTGPVAALVDGETASAAEMLAGALSAYDRGVVVGSKTYGKGCAQEYLDDDVGAGVLRLTTLVFALPDGSPLQRVGVSPHIALALPATTEAEENLEHAPTTWRGPDVRDKDFIRSVPWPDHKGRVGIAEDETTHRALRALGATRAASR